MPYTLNHRANHTVEVTAELDAATVDRERETIIRGFSRRARVPGFRPGKAPAAAVRARFGSEIQDELQEHLTGVLMREVFDGDDGLEPLTQPQLSAIGFSDEGPAQCDRVFRRRRIPIDR
jgi:trigger factor